MSDSRKRLPGSEKLTRPEDLKALSKYLGEIKRIQEEHTSLETDNLEVPGRTTGRLPNITSLPDSAVGLEAGGDVSSLDSTRIELETEKEVKLSDYIETLDTEKSIKLEERKIGLEGNQKEIELSETKIELSDTQDDISLSEDRVGLDNTTSGQVLNLSEFKENLEVDKNRELTETRIDLDVDKEANLSETRINLEKPEEIDLDKSRVNLEKPKNAELDNTRIDLKKPKDAELDNTRIDLEKPEDVNLDETRVNLEKPKDAELDNTRIDLEKPEEAKLDNTRVNLEKPEDTELDNTRVALGEIKDVELVDKKIDLKVNSDVELDKTKISLEDDREVDLSDYLESLDTEEIKSLDDTQIKGPEEVEIAKLYDTLLAGPDKNDPDSLSDAKIKLEASEKIDELEGKRLNLEFEEKVGGLEDRVLITPDSANENGWNGEELYNSLMLAPDDKKYEKIMEMSSSMGNWGAKVASLVSAVLSNDNISADRASWFDTELKKLLYQMGALSRSLKDSNVKAQQLADDLNGGNIDSNDQDSDSENAILDKYRDKISRPSHSLKDSNVKAQQLAEASQEFFDDMREGSEITRPEAANSDTYIEGSGNSNEERKYSPAKKLLELYESPHSGDTNKQGYQTIPNYKLPSRGILDTLNISKYIRFGAEELFSSWDPKTVVERKIKGTLLDEALALMFIAREQLEKTTKSNRDRLPGDDMGLIGDLVSGGASGALENLKDNAKSAIQNTFAGAKGINKLNPLNRPKTKRALTTNGQFGGDIVKQPTTGFELGNDRDETLENAGLKENLGKNLVNSLIGDLADDKLGKDQLSFKKRYIEGSTGMAITLMDLCNLDATQKYSLGSVEQLQELLKQSPYITTPAQFGTSEFGKYKTMTLDSNAYWEVTIEPFCHYAMNGGYSFLPAIQEINWQNAITHGSWQQGDKKRTVTNYHKWVPIVGFELEKSRLTTKSLGLYDGEINYPISSELTNELRMTIADDQYKSWRNYFQKCADVAVYSSEAHDQSYYIFDRSYISAGLKKDELKTLIEEQKSREMGVPTVVDKSRIAVASYKNITFRIKIYIMTPQYSTIRRFDLLCVLKDFQESYSGDIDAGGYDLNVSFSIVGENPPTDGETEDNKPIKGDHWVKKNNTIVDVSKINGSKTVNKSSSLIKLL